MNVRTNSGETKNPTNVGLLLKCFGWGLIPFFRNQFPILLFLPPSSVHFHTNQIGIQLVLRKNI